MMHPLTREALYRLKSDKISISPEDAILLNDYACKTSKCSDQRLLNHSGTYVGNVEIFPLTIGAKVWLKTDVMDWFEHDEFTSSLCYVYATVYSRFPDRFVFRDARQCRKEIKKWARGVNISQDELIEVFDSEDAQDVDILLKDLYDQIIKDPSTINLVPVVKHLTDRDVHGHRDEGTTPIVAFLMANLGKSVQYWLWEHSWDDIDALIASTIKNSSGEERIDSRDPSILSMKRFQTLLAKVRKQNV